MKTYQRNFARTLLAAAVMASVGATSYAAYPEQGDFDGHYTFAADVKLENQAYAPYVKGSFNFAIATSDYGTVITDFMVPNIYTEYDSGTGELTLTTNYGKFGYSNLGFADADATWTGMGTMYGSLLKWQIGEDGSISVPDFTLVDFSKYSTTGKVTVVARISGCEVGINTDVPDDEPGDDEQELFEGRYVFTARQTTYNYVRDEDGQTTLDSEVVEDGYRLVFEINEYNQMHVFDEYALLRQHINTLRNRGVTANGVYRLDTDTYNGVEWVYNTAVEDAASTDAKLFGGSGTDNWIQGQTAVVLTRKDDGTFSLRPFTLWQRTMEDMVGAEDVVNRVRVLRPIRKWDNIEFESYSSAAVVTADEDVAEPVYYNLQGVCVDNPGAGIYIRRVGSKATKVVVR